MRRWRSSTATAIALTVAVAMVLSVSIQQLVSAEMDYLGPQHREIRDEEDAWLLAQVPGKLAQFVDLLNSIPNAARPTAMAAMRGPVMRPRIANEPLQGLVNRTDPPAERLRQRITEVLTIPQLVLIVNQVPVPGQQSGNVDPSIQRAIVVEARLPDGHWFLLGLNLNAIVATLHVEPDLSWASLIVWLALSLPLAIVLSIVTARRLVTPLSELAIAVDQLGGSGDEAAFRTTVGKVVATVAPSLARDTNNLLFGEIWRRPGLSPRDAIG